MKKDEDYARVVGFSGETLGQATNDAVALREENTRLRAEREAARVRAYRAARIFEPGMDGWAAAMAVYEAAFGPEPGAVTIVVDGKSIPAPRR